MKNIKIILILFVLIWFYKLIDNIYSYIRINSLYKKYKTHEDIKNSNNIEIAEYLSEIRELFLKAHIAEDLQVPFKRINIADLTEESGKIKPLMNICSNLPEIEAFYNIKFLEARGYFKKGIIDSINPLYWIKFYIYFPQSLLNYLNIINEIFIKAINITYWLGIIYIIFTALK